jgi:ADP-heptose:LPS heptosyltransferase
VKDSSLNGKAVFVTGGASGLGAALCNMLAASGAKVVVGDLKKDRAEAIAESLRSDDVQAHAIGFDVGDPQAAAQAIDEAIEKLGKLGAMISCAPVVVSNNTGPAHIAAALGTPIVVLYALTNPQHTPWQVRRRVLYRDVPCRFCYKSVCPQQHHDCMSKVEPSQVLEAVRELLRSDLSEHNEAGKTLFFRALRERTVQPGV